MTTDTLERTDEVPKLATSDLELEGIISAYLYYLDFGGGSTVVSEAIYEYYDRPGATVNRDNLVLQLATNAHTGGDDPIPYTTNHQYFMMRRKSWLIIVAANAPDIDDVNSIEFVGVDSQGRHNDGRHTFLNINYSAITFGATRLQIVTCENHMQSKANRRNLDPREWEDFQFTLQFDGAAARLLGPDSGGTNMGPPVPPPAFR
ncbi:MAG TPA: hypothetical protein VIT38_15350 [Allosphingosinicella sp.]